MSELKPCPFCGSAGRYIARHRLEYQKHFVKCSNNNCWLSDYGVIAPIWNTRHEAAKAEGQPSMGKRVMYEDGTSSREYEEQPDELPVQEIKPCPYVNGFTADNTGVAFVLQRYDTYSDFILFKDGKPSRCFRFSNAVSPKREPSQADEFTPVRDDKLIALLERLSCLGNGDSPGNSIGNVMAQEALEMAKNPPYATKREYGGVNGIMISYFPAANEADGDYLKPCVSILVHDNDLKPLIEESARTLIRNGIPHPSLSQIEAGNPTPLATRQPADFPGKHDGGE